MHVHSTIGWGQNTQNFIVSNAKLCEKKLVSFTFGINNPMKPRFLVLEADIHFNLTLALCDFTPGVEKTNYFILFPCGLHLAQKLRLSVLMKQILN